MVRKSAKQKKIFLDYASATPVRAEVARAMKPYSENIFANPSALYQEGLAAGRAVKDSRKKIAKLLSCRAEEIIFTSGGTESDNLAILGVFEACLRRGFGRQAAQRAGLKRPHIVTSVIEHPAILESCREVERRGGRVTYLPVDSNGRISLVELERTITKDTCLITLAHSNSEIGTIIPVRKIVEIVKRKRTANNSAYPYFHLDAGQAPLFISARPNELSVDFLTLDAAKFYGPKGSGLLFAKRDTSVSPIIFGGAQESGRRAGTENVSAIVGLAEALAIAVRDQKTEPARLTKLRDYFIKQVLGKISGSILNGDLENRLPNNANFCFPDANGEFLVIKLDVAGIACSSAASCRTLTNESYSYVVEALGRKKCAESSLRFTLGRHTTKQEIDRVIKILQKTLRK